MGATSCVFMDHGTIWVYLQYLIRNHTFCFDIQTLDIIVGQVSAYDWITSI